jgi:hypothetical protein
MENDQQSAPGRAALDKEWSDRVAAIAVGTCVAAKPPLLAELAPEQIERCFRIVAEEIYIRLIMGDRPPP